MQYLHGVEVAEISDGPRQIRVARSSVIGLIGTAPEADEERFPFHTPVLIAGKRTDAVGLGTSGTLPPAIDDIFDQTGAVIVLIRIPEPAITEDGALLPSGIDDTTGQYLGVSAFLAAESEVFVTPRILVAPEFSQNLANANELISVAERLRAIVVADGPNTNDADAITFRENFGSDRLYIVDPWIRVANPEAALPLPDPLPDPAPVIPAELVRPASARIAGIIAKSDSDRGFWWSPSNQEIRGILGTFRNVDFALGDFNARANLLNENEVTTIIRKNGFRLWGNRTTSADPRFAFLSVRRTADIINDSILAAHLWAVDRNITRTYLEDVLEGVNGFLRSLQTQGAIINGRAWADPELNTPDQIEQGIIHIDFDFTPPFPAEHIVFRSRLVNDYLVEVLPTEQ